MGRLCFQRISLHTEDDSQHHLKELAYNSKGIFSSVNLLFIWYGFYTHVSDTIATTGQQQPHTVVSAYFPVSLCDI